MDLVARLADLRRRSIDLSAVDGRIRFLAPSGVMTPLDREFLASNKEAILDFLKLGKDDGPGIIPVPLTSAGSTASGESENQADQQSFGRARRPARTSSRVSSPPPGGGCEPRSDSRYSSNSRNSSPVGSFANYSNIANGPDEVEQGDCPSLVKLGVEDQMLVCIGEKAYTYGVWKGETLDGDRLGLDTETALIRDNEVPELALASVSNGTDHYLIHPDRLGEFILRHRGRHLVVHNSAFDHWVIVRHLEAKGEAEALEAWWEIVDAGRLHDTMLMDSLVRLGRTDAEPKDRDLGVVAGEYAGLFLDKGDPFRLRYAEIIGKDWGAVERGFFDYAIKDPIATLAAYEAMIVEAAGIMAAHGLDPVEVARQHGFLGENYQVKAAIALTASTRLGMALDSEQVAATGRAVLDQLQGYAAELSAIPGSDVLFRRDRQGYIIERPKTPAPSIRQDQLRRLLVEHAGRVAVKTGLAIPEATSEGGKVSLAAGTWEPFAPFDPFIRAWLAMEAAAKAYQFLAGLKDPVVHPHYGFTRTARVKFWKPNTHQMPRKGGFRESFVARPGYVLLILDYRFIELRTLAAVCEAWFGHSRLAEVIRDGIDPHVFTAAMLAGIEFVDFKALASSNDTGDHLRYDDLRQKAKAINFGIPGGLGATALVAYALANYGVEMTLEEAGRFRDKLIHEVYPELALYLADDGMMTLARNLGTTAEACWKRLDWKRDRSGAVVGGVRNVAAGKLVSAKGRPYKKRYLDGVWGGLVELNRNPELAPLLARRKGGEELRDRLFRSGVTTLTGRVRGRVGFTQARNTPFQGLAADGAKLAFYELTRAGYRVVAFIHDEFVIELPDGADHAEEARRIESMIIRAMESLTGDVPVGCEYALARRWSKKAKAVFDGDGRLVPWGEGQAGAKPQ